MLRFAAYIHFPSEQRTIFATCIVQQDYVDVFYLCIVENPATYNFRIVKTLLELDVNCVLVQDQDDGIHCAWPGELDEVTHCIQQVTMGVCIHPKG